RDRVHEPGHHLGVGAHVRGRDVAVRPDQDRDLGGEAAGQVLELAGGELAGVDDDAAFGAAVGDVDHGALPGHPHGEGLDLVQRDVRVEAEAALGRAAIDVVLDAIPGVAAHAAVVHLDREVAGELPLDLSQDHSQAGVQLEHVGGLVELVLRRVPRVGLGDLLGYSHGPPSTTSTPTSEGTPPPGR